MKRSAWDLALELSEVMVKIEKRLDQKEEMVKAGLVDTNRVRLIDAKIDELEERMFEIKDQLKKIKVI